MGLTSTAETGSLVFNFLEEVYEEELAMTVVVRGEVVQITASQRITLRPSGHVFEGSRWKAVDGAWRSETGDPAPGPLYQIDGSTVIGSGTLTDQLTHEEHVVEFGVDCAD